MPLSSFKSTYAKRQNSELSLDQTRAVEDVISEAGLATFVLARPLAQLDFIHLKSGNFAHDSASGLTFPKPRIGEYHAYPWIIVKPVFRIDTLPMGNEILRPAKSPAVPVMTSLIEFMKGVLLHEVGHYVLDEASPKVKEKVEQTYSTDAIQPISQYAQDDFEEYFCETLVAYVFYQKLLEKYDPIGYTLIREVIQFLKEEF